MADPIVGTWDVSLVQNGVVRYRYKYTCTTSFKVTWYDYFDETETGGGTWKRSGDRIIFDWKPSGTSEYWIPSPTVDGSAASGVVEASYGNFTIVASRLDKADDSQDLIKQWNDSIESGDAFSSPNVCPLAIPYLQRLPPNTKPLNQRNVGPSIQKVKGLAIHTTWGFAGAAATEKTVSACLNTWNAAGVPTCAHFAIAYDGTLLQFVPVNRIAWAQGGQADQCYLSVEIETKETAANADQIGTAAKLFRWVVGKFGVPPNLATGFIGAHGDGRYAADAERIYNPITTRMCADAGVDTTTNKAVAAAASGLSCHYWLHPVKPCPGGPLLRQLADIAIG